MYLYTHAVINLYSTVLVHTCITLICYSKMLQYLVYYHCSDSDINECNTGNGGCSQICTNSIGSFECRCNSGYNLAADGRTCLDINECQLNTDNCQQTCTNTAGGFACSCNSGLALNSDGRTCSGEL